jgi:SNF2 family DNA or RNA helicase
MLFASPTRRRTAKAALDELNALLQAGSTQMLARDLDLALRHVATEPADVWADYELRAADYNGILNEIADLKVDVASVHGFIPAEIADRVNNLSLDTSKLRNVSLRGYQAFGAKFALVQRRAIIGDEMGLGKTIEAIAAMAHLAARGKEHFLVVCPAGVLVNWCREIAERSMLRPYRVHGTDLHLEQSRWQNQGGVAVTTFETLKKWRPEGVAVAMLVVDEAHYAKNPAAARSKAIAALAEQCERVLFMTGTPMENRVEEFHTLVGYLNPRLPRSIDASNGLLGSEVFRRSVAPVYVRRNQEDVLTELPERLEIDDWVEFTREDQAEYRDAVASGNFMAMRRAAFRAGSPEHSAKLLRLDEILGESADNGWKVVVFSFFHDVLNAAMKLDRLTAFGPLTGKVSPADRQRIVDDFSRHKGPAVLFGQIDAGGTGLNIQAASVVVLTEPQWKPTIEDQAIARCHRMGQVRRVHVHRLLAADSVDARMVEIVGRKRALFDDYARRSDMRDASPDAVDVSNVELAASEAKIIAAERERLGMAVQDAVEQPSGQRRNAGRSSGG